MKWAAVYALGATILLLGLGCGPSPTAPAYEVLTPRQARIYDLSQCFAQELGLGVLRVEFHDDLDGAAGRSWPGSGTVMYHIESVENGEDWYLEGLAAHEVCHASGIWEQDRAEACATLLIAKGVCP